MCLDRSARFFRCCLVFGFLLGCLSVLSAQKKPPVPVGWTFEKKVRTPGYLGDAKFPYYPSVLTKQNGMIRDCRPVASKATQPGMLAVSEDHGGSSHSGVRIYTFHPRRPDQLRLLTTVESPLGSNHMETPWLFVRPSDGKLCMTAHSSNSDGQVTILFSTEDGVNWTHEGTALSNENGGHTGYARGYIDDQGTIYYISLHRGGSNPAWRLSKDEDGDGLNAQMIGDPIGYLEADNGRGTEPSTHQILEIGKTFWGLFLRKKIGSSGSGIGNSTLLLQQYDHRKANSYGELFKNVTGPRHVLVKPGSNTYTTDGVTSVALYRYQGHAFMYVAGRAGRGTNMLLLYSAEW